MIILTFVCGFHKVYLSLKISFFWVIDRSFFVPKYSLKILSSVIQTQLTKIMIVIFKIYFCYKFLE